MSLAVDLYSTWTGNAMSESEGWMFMMALKMARMTGGEFRLDDYLDLVGYGVLLTECVTEEQAE